MYKRTTLLDYGFNLAAAPADHDFVIDGDYADIVLNVLALSGMAPDLDLDVFELIDPRLNLAYDAQTANYTVGAIVTGQQSGATGVIVADTDGGATGTLELKGVNGRFRDNELIADDNGTPGSATVNSATGGTWAYTEGALYGQQNSVATGTRYQISVHESTNVLHPIHPRRFRLAWTLNSGSISDLDYTVELVMGSIASTS